MVYAKGPMVKHLKYLRHLKWGWIALKRLVLIGTMVFLILAFWLHQSERSLAFAKPWILQAVNSDDAPYTITIGDVSVDWTNVALLGKMRLSNVSMAKRDGNLFAQLPEVYATIDPIGFLPTRNLLHKVILRQPRMFATRTKEGAIELGVEGSPARIALATLADFFASNGGKDAKGEATPLSLPMHDFLIDRATFTFTDEASATKIISAPFNFALNRRGRNYQASLSMPFTMDDQHVLVSANYLPQAKGDQHVLALKLSQWPTKLFCLFDNCPAKFSTDGAVDALVKAVIADDFSISDYEGDLVLPKLTLTAPEQFAEPLHITGGHVQFDGEWDKQQLHVKQATLPLTDTTITIGGTVHKDADGWHAAGEGATTRLDVDKIYKYWPLVMAHDSRAWVTEKLKSGYAAKGTLKFNLTPNDIATGVVADDSIDATADARDITFEYLPGFPLVEHMDGVAHFTGTTVRTEATSGSLLSGTKINHAMLWCPQLADPKNPMEAEVKFVAPAADAATMLALKYFTFDDALMLDPATIKGTMDASMKLKFDAFSGNTNSNPNEIHLEKVDYDINANLQNIAQDKIAGSYDVKSLNGTLKAGNTGMNLKGTARLGEAGANDFTLSQPSGKALSLDVKGSSVAGGPPAKNPLPVSQNDFSLTYVSGDIPAITITGKCLDMSSSYGSTKGTTLLANFPAMNLEIGLDQLLLSKDVPIRDVQGSLSCSAARCDTANFTARAEKSAIKGGIQTIGGSRQFLMTASDAGSTLTALGLTDRMSRGQMKITGQYDDRKTPPQLNASVRIDDFTLRNSEILGRIFSIGSLTGLSNALTGSGISFDKLAANVASRGGVLTVNRAIANGNSIGITTAGTIDTVTTKLALKGVVVPAYALNSILGKIPIIGMIAGGDEGLIAFNYSVNGTYDQPDVGVNPLSGLTPGFLRGIFGIFDDKTPKPANDAESATDKPAKSKPAGVDTPSAVQRR